MNENDVNELVEFGKRVAELRAMRGMTLQDLADKCGESAIRRHFRGETPLYTVIRPAFLLRTFSARKKAPPKRGEKGRVFKEGGVQLTEVSSSGIFEGALYSLVM